MGTRFASHSKVFVALVIACFSTASLAIGGYAPGISSLKYIATYTVNQDGSYREDDEQSFLIETEQGISKYGDQDISYIPKLERVEIQDAYTILPNGTLIKVPKKNIRTTSDALNQGGAVYSDTKHKMVIYPNVGIGSQLYIKYSKIVHTPVFPGQFTARESTTPHGKFHHFEVNLNFDPRMDIQVDSKGFDGGRLPDKNGLHRYKFVRKQDTFVAPEADQISEDDYAPYVQASSFKNYEALGAAYEEKAKQKAKVTPAIQKLAENLTKGMDDKKDQVRRLYNWVSKNIRYIGLYIGNGGYVPHDSQTIMDNRWGDCKDHVVILEALLSAKGIASSPALINADASYALPKLAVDAFNHVITYVPSLDLYLDSTSQFAPFGTLPASDLNKQVVLTALNKMGKTPMMRAEEQKSQTAIRLKILSDGTIHGLSHTQATGDSEINLRNWQFEKQTAPQDLVINSILSDANLTGIGQIHSSDPSNLDKPLEIDTTFTLDPVSNFPGPAAMPITAGVAFEVIDGKMLPKPKDKINFPIKCESFSFRNHFEIEFPLNVKIKQIPEDVSYVDDIGHYTSTYLLTGNVLEINRDMVVQHPTMVCGQAEIEMDKKFFPIFQRDMRAQVIYE